MDKGKIRVALAALSVAGLVAGMTLTGCAGSGSCSAGSCTGKMKPQQPAGSSCGAGSCSGTKPAPPAAEPKAPEMSEPK